MSWPATTCGMVRPMGAQKRPLLKATTMSEQPAVYLRGRLLVWDESDTKGRDYECEPAPGSPILVNGKHAAWHRRQKGKGRPDVFCEEARLQESAQSYYRNHQSFEGFQGRRHLRGEERRQILDAPRRWQPGDCEWKEDDDWDPNGSHRKSHEFHGESLGISKKPCKQARRENSAYNWLRRFGTLDGWEWPPARKRLDRPWHHYRIYFEDGSRYDGICQGRISVRITGHKSTPFAEVGIRLRAGMPHVVQHLGTSSDYEKALKHEIRLMNQPHPFGAILNKQGMKRKGLSERQGFWAIKSENGDDDERQSG